MRAHKKTPRLSSFETTPASQPEYVPLLQELGLGDRVKQKVSKLSMGERQRVCRSLKHFRWTPSWCLPNEPTGHLDPKRGPRSPRSAHAPFAAAQNGGATHHT